MATLEALARAALDRDTLATRSLTQDLLRASTKVESLSRPETDDSRLLVMAAALAELLAMRQHQPPPAWASQVGALQEPFYLLKSAESMKRLRTLCETQSPEPLRKRGLYAPPNFLEFA
jgi:hypothetical protein